MNDRHPAGANLARYSYAPDRADRQMQLCALNRLQRTPLLAIEGASCHLVTATILQRMRYLHAVDRQMLFATLAGRTRWSSGQIASGAVVRRPDAPGALSLKPAGWERRGEIGPGRITCAHIELQPALIAEMTGRRHDAVDWTAPFNANEPKLFWMIKALADEMQSPAPLPMLREALLVAIARRVAPVSGCAAAWPAFARSRAAARQVRASHSRPATAARRAARPLRSRWMRGSTMPSAGCAAALTPWPPSQRRRASRSPRTGWPRCGGGAAARLGSCAELWRLRAGQLRPYQEIRASLPGTPETHAARRLTT